MPQTISLQDVYRELLDIKQRMISKEELTTLIETVEILKNPGTMRQLRKSEQDIRTGRTKRVRGVKDLLTELA